MPKITNPRELLIEELKDLYSAETQLIKALPKMAKAASDPSLQEAFTSHLEETRGHVQRLESIMDQLDEKPTGKTCKAMKGLVEEGKEAIDEDATDAMRDLLLIAAAQRVEHYEIAGYGCARTLAEIAGEDEIAATLQETLDEEGQADKTLTSVASDISWESEDSDDEDGDDLAGAGSGSSSNKRAKRR